MVHSQLDNPLGHHIVYNPNSIEYMLHIKALPPTADVPYLVAFFAI